MEDILEKLGIYYIEFDKEGELKMIKGKTKAGDLKSNKLRRDTEQ